MRNFEKWILTLKSNIASWDYFTEYSKVYANVIKYDKQLELINSIINSKNIRDDFKKIVEKDKTVLELIPRLMAKRENVIEITDLGNDVKYDFVNLNHTYEEYADFMEKTHLFDLLQNHIKGKVKDYLIGLEVGMDTNARKNRTGKSMETIIENYLQSLGLIKNKTYWSQFKASDIKKQFNIDVTNIDNKEKAEKRFDFVVYKNNVVYAIECNFYQTQGSKLNETARSYKNIAIESKNIKNFKFIWITDGHGWNYAKNNLKETFDVLEDLYNLNDLKNGVLNKYFK